MVMGVSVRVGRKTLAGTVVCNRGRSDGIVAFDGDATLEGTQDLVMPCDNFVVLFEAAEDFDVSGAGDACGYGDKANAEAVVILGNEVDALNEV
jgi:hypothetical protein